MMGTVGKAERLFCFQLLGQVKVETCGIVCCMAFSSVVAESPDLQVLKMYGKAHSAVIHSLWLFPR